MKRSSRSAHSGGVLQLFVSDIRCSYLTDAAARSFVHSLARPRTAPPLMEDPTAEQKAIWERYRYLCSLTLTFFLCIALD